LGKVWRTGWLVADDRGNQPVVCSRVLFRVRKWLKLHERCGDRRCRACLHASPIAIAIAPIAIATAPSAPPIAATSDHLQFQHRCQPAGMDDATAGLGRAILHSQVGSHAILWYWPHFRSSRRWVVLLLRRDEWMVQQGVFARVRRLSLLLGGHEARVDLLQLPHVRQQHGHAEARRRLGRDLVDQGWRPGQRVEERQPRRCVINVDCVSLSEWFELPGRRFH